MGGPDPPNIGDFSFVGLGRAGQNRAKIFQTSIPVMLEAVPTLHSQVQLRGGKRQKRPFTEGRFAVDIFSRLLWGPLGHFWRSFPAHLNPWEVISGTFGSLGALWELRGVTAWDPG